MGKKYNEVKSHAIINNNYEIRKIFDDVDDGSTGYKYLSKEDAETKLKELRNNKRYLQSFEIVKSLAIVGIVPFNDEIAYVFNKRLPICILSDYDKIVASTYENLMGCYVFTSASISKILLNQLVSEYYKRGGVVYDDYYSFEKKELVKERNKRKFEYRNNIVSNYIHKHGFLTLEEGKWVKENITIEETDYSKLSLDYGSVKNHYDLKASSGQKVLIGSIFSNFYKEIHQLSEDVFCIRCGGEQKDPYRFVCFVIKFNQTFIFPSNENL